NGTEINNSTVIDLLVSTDYGSLDSVVFNWDGAENSSLASPWDINTSLSSGSHWLNVYVSNSLGLITAQHYLFFIKKSEYRGIEVLNLVLTLLFLTGITSVTLISSFLIYRKRYE
ncbi:MAG: hypothetical protein ACTSP4_17365, partial [Candidatus Hodarchaeales archaeon]